MWNSSSLSRLVDKIRELSTRDRIALLIGGVSLLLFVLFQFVFQPLADKRDSLEAGIRAREKELVELSGIVRQFESLNAGSSKLSEAEKNFNLFAALERIANQCDIMDKVEYMKPGSMELDSLRKEDWVEVKLNDTTLKQITRCLYMIRTSGYGIYLKRFSARKDGEFLNVVMQPAVSINK